MLKIAVTFKHLFEVSTHFGHNMLKLVHLVFDLLQVTKGGERRHAERRRRAITRPR